MTSSLLVASLLLHFTMLLRCSIRVTALTLVSQNDTTSGSAEGDWFENSGVDFSISCGDVDCVYLARENTTVTIPCGKYERAPGISFTYYIKGSRKPLISEATDFPRFTLSWHNSSTTLCCAPNTSSNILRDSTCYILNVTYSPRIVKWKWPAGSSKWPVYDEPLILICPLESNPPARYSWRRYNITRYNIADSESAGELNISADVSFTEGGRRMEIIAYRPELHNGLYVCYASNALGRKEYFDSHFLLHTEFCNRFKTANISRNIAPSGDLQYRSGDNVTLNCSFYPVQELDQRPYWFFVNYDKDGNVTIEYVESSDNTHQKLRYDKSKCIWKNTLTIFNFSDEWSGTYSCGYSYHIINQTLKLLEEDDVSLSFKSHQNPQGGQLLLSLLTALGVVIAIGLFVFLAVCVRWKMIRRFSYSTSKEPPSSGFDYDVFLSAHDEVRGLVQHKILHQLESHDPPYKVCWHLRDFMVGLPINEQIATSILQSRKILFVFSEHFTESQFCCSELDQALHRFQTTRTRCILPIVLNEDTVPKKLKSVLTYWPLVNLNDAHFPEKITKLLGSPVSVMSNDAVVNEDDNTNLL